MPTARPAREQGSYRADLVFLRLQEGCWAEKRHGDMHGYAGNADIYGCIQGRHFELEKKRVGEKAKKVQDSRMRRWARCGAITGVYHNRTELIAIFAQHGVTLENKVTTKLNAMEVQADADL